MSQVASTPAGAPVAPVAPQQAARAGAQEMYQAMRAQRRELGRQLEGLEQKRSELSRELQGTEGVDRKGIEQRLTEIDQRIAETDKQVAAADAGVAQAAAVPGAAVELPRPPREGPPEEFFVLSGIFIVAVLMPLSIAMARRIWRRGAAAAVAASALPRELFDRFTRLEQAVDAVAVEMERVGEGQRFVTSVLADPAGARALGAGAAEPIDVRQRERVAQRRTE